MAAGTYTVVASFAGSADYAPAGAMTTFTVNLAAPTVTVTDAGGTFNGQPFPATATVAGVVVGVDNTPSTTLEGAGLTLTYYAGNMPTGTPLSGAPSAVGTYTAVASFAGSAITARPAPVPRLRSVPPPRQSRSPTQAAPTMVNRFQRRPQWRAWSLAWTTRRRPLWRVSA